MPIKRDNEFHKTLQNLIARNKTQEAIQLLIERGDANAAVMKGQLDVAQAGFEGKRISFEEFTRVQNRLNYSILNTFADDINNERIPFMARMDALNESREAHPLGPVPHARVRDLIQQNKTAEAIELCRNLGDDYVQLTARWNNLKKHFQLGLVSEAEREQITANIHNAMLTLMLEAPDGEIEGPAPDSEPQVVVEKKAEENLWTRFKRIFGT